jgi:hypothetical protein
MTVPPQARLEPAQSVLTRPVGNELVLLNLKTEMYFGLDPVGAAMWVAICESETLSAAHSALQDMFDVDANELGADLQELVQQLVDQQLLVVRAD